MPAGAFTLYSKSVQAMSEKKFDLSADTFVVTLHTNSYVPAADTDALWSDVSASEMATAAGYTAGGLVLASETDTLTVATVKFTAASPSWATFSAGPFRYAVITHRVAGALVAGDLLLCFSDLTGGGSISGIGGSYTITISGSGIFALTHTP